MQLLVRWFAVLLCLIAIPALADTRVALVIGNAAYEKAPLSNPTVDVDLIRPALERMGFEVTVVKDAGLEAFDAALSAFEEQARGADVALFYFAGHGFAVNDGLAVRNYLMSTDADVTATSERVIKRDGIALDEVIESLSASARTTLVFVDACRNDPRVSRGKGRGRGLARLPETGTQVFVGLSTRLGDVAEDGDPGEGSPFARAFVATLPQPGERLDDAFRKLRQQVSTETKGDQQPEAARDDLDQAIVLMSGTSADSAQARPTLPPSHPDQGAAVAPREALKAIVAAKPVSKSSAEAAERIPIAQVVPGETGAAFDLTQGHSQAVTAVAFFRNMVVSASKDGSVKLWNLEDGSLSQTLRGHEGEVSAVAASASGLIASGGVDGTVRIYDGPNEVQTLRTDRLGSRALAFSPDGTILASGVYKAVEIWDVKSGTLVRTIEDAQDGSVDGLDFSPDGRWIATQGYEKTARIWEVATGEPRHVLQHEDNVRSLAFAAGGAMLATGSGKSILLWDVDTGERLRTIEAHKYMVADLAASPDGKRLASSGGAEKTVRLWDVETGAPGLTIDESVYSSDVVAFSDDGQTLVTGSAGAEVNVWDAKGGLLLHSFQIQADHVEPVAFAPDGTLAVGGALAGDTGVSFWNSADATLARFLDGDGSYLNALAFSGDGTLLAGGSSREVEVWRASDGERVMKVAVEAYDIPAIAITPDAKAVAAIDDKVTRLWDIATGTLLLTFEGHADKVEDIAISPDGRLLATGSGDKTIKLWDLASGTLVRTLEGSSYGVSSVAFSPDGKALASGSFGQVALWDVTTGQRGRSFDGLSSTIVSLAFSPDGKQIAVAEQGLPSLALLDVASGRLSARLGSHLDGILNLAFSRDGTLLATSSSDHTVKLWNLSRAGAEAATLVTYKRQAASVTDGGLWLSGPETATFVSVRKADGGQEPIAPLMKNVAQDLPLKSN